MVRTYVRKTNGYSDDDVLRALSMIKNGNSIRKAATLTGVPKSSLIEHQKSFSLNPKKKKFVIHKGRKPSLSQQEENDIVRSIIAVSDLGWPMDMGDAAQLVGRYCKKRKKETQFRNDIPGSDFMGKFYKRNKTKISRRRSTSIKIARARSEHPVIISEFFDLLDQAFKTAKVDVKNHSHGGRVFSIDETGYKSKIQTKGFLCPVGRPALVLANSEGKTNFSTLICGNALGEFYPPSVVYKGSNKSLPAGWVMNGPPGTTYNTTKSGWMDQERFLAWLRWFDEKLTEKQVERPVVVVMDGASSHISVDIVEEAREKNIVLVKLPPNSTHFLQALDVGVFGPSKVKWEKIIKHFSRQTRPIIKAVSKSAFPALLSLIFDDLVNNPQNLISGFRSTGIWPMNKEKIMEKVESRGIYKTVASELLSSEENGENQRADSTSNTPAENITEITNEPHSSADSTSNTPAENITEVTNEPHSSGVRQQISAPLLNSSISSESDNGNVESSEEGPDVQDKEESNAALVSAIKEILVPPKDSTIEKISQNEKNRVKVIKLSGAILTSDDALKALKEKEKAKNVKNTKSTDKNISKDQKVITKYFPTRSTRSSKNVKYNEVSTDTDNSDLADDPPVTENVVESKLKVFWKSISPPNKEAEIIGKWYGGIYKDDTGRESLCIGRAVHRFLEDEDGKVLGVELGCLKPHVGNNKIMEEYAEEENGTHLFNHVFSLENLFIGPIKMEPLAGRKWSVPDLIKIRNLYDTIIGHNRSDLVSTF